MLCKNACLTINDRVDAFVALNEMQIGGIGVEIINSHSIVCENVIQQSHNAGVKVICDAKAGSGIGSSPLI
jgi:hypothetical protein